MFLRIGLIAQLLCRNNSPSACVFFVCDDEIKKNVLSLENFLITILEKLNH